MKKIGFLFLMIAAFAGCQRSDMQTAKEEMMQADRDFSKLSESDGMNKAFLTYFDSAGVLLRSNHKPTIGIAEIRKLYTRPDEGFTLTWEPVYGDISISCDMGFTVGIWTLTTEGNTSKGTYLSVWRKNKEGKWKLAADTGNDGIGE